jgi:hypothetical protein
MYLKGVLKILVSLLNWGETSTVFAHHIDRITT